MIQLIFALLLAEVGLLITLLIKCPLRKLVILVLDRIKRGRGPFMVKTVGATVCVVLASSLHSMHKIHERSSSAGLLNPTDQVLFTRHLLEASLIGYALFMWLIIDRVHHYISEIRGMKKSTEDMMKQKRILEDGRFDEMERKKDVEIRELDARIVQLELDVETKGCQMKSAEASGVALGKQFEGFLLEYDRLLEENQNLRNELKLMDRRFSHSDSKKFS